MMIARDKFHIGRRQQHGFTLVELMVTVAVLLILLAVGVPQLQGFMQRRQVVADTEALATALRLAQSEALKRSGTVSICPLAAPTTGAGTGAAAVGAPCAAAATKNWSHGWMVFIDVANTSGVTHPYDPSRDTIIRMDEGTRTGNITYNRDARVLSFEGNGLLKRQKGTFNVSPADTSQCSGLVVSAQGRVRGGACKVEEEELEDDGPAGDGGSGLGEGGGEDGISTPAPITPSAGA